MKKLVAIIIATALLCMALLPLTATAPKTKEADIFDALEILKSLVGMENKAAQLTGITDRELTIYDVLDILKGIVGMGEPVIVNVVEEGTEPPVTTTAPPGTSTAPATTTAPPRTTTLPATTTTPVATTTPGTTEPSATTTNTEPLPGEIDFQVVEYLERIGRFGEHFTLTPPPPPSIALSLEELNAIVDQVEVGGYLSKQAVDESIFNESFFEDKAVVVFYCFFPQYGHKVVVDLLEEENNLIVNRTVGFGYTFHGDANTTFRIILAVERTVLETMDSISHGNYSERHFIDESYKCDCLIPSWSCRVYNLEKFNNWFNNWFELKKLF